MSVQDDAAITAERRALKLLYWFAAAATACALLSPLLNRLAYHNLAVILWDFAKIFSVAAFWFGFGFLATRGLPRR